MSKFDYILFDWDGCLADTLNLWLVTLRKIFKSYGFDFSDDQIVKKFFVDSDGYLGLNIPNKNKFLVDYKKFVDSWMPNVGLNENAVDVLEFFYNKGKKMAIVTSSSRKSVTKALINLGIKKYFDLILGYEDVAKKKPDSEIIIKALKKLKGEINKAIIIGDSFNDIKAGKKANIKTVLYLSQENKIFYNLGKKFEEISKMANYTVENLKDLKKIII